MKKIKKITAFILAAVLIFTLTSCNSNSSSSSEAIKADEVTAPFNSRADETLVPETGIGTKTLVAYFSATSNTKSVAEKIARRSYIMIEKHNLSGIIPYPSIKRRPRRHMINHDIFRIGGKIPHQANASRKTFVKSVRVHLRLITKLTQNLVHIEKLAARRVRRMQSVGDLNDFHGVRPSFAKSITRHSYFP